MLFALHYDVRPNLTEEAQKRAMTLLAKWTPPSAYGLKHHHARADGTGGMGFVETDSAVAIMEVCGTWTAFYDIRLVPVVPVEEGVKIQIEAAKWRDSTA